MKSLHPDQFDRRPDIRHWWKIPIPESEGYGLDYVALKYDIKNEPLIETIAVDGTDIGIVTRNRYDARILNTAAMLIADVDLHDDHGRCANGMIFRAVLSAAVDYGRRFDLVALIRQQLDGLGAVENFNWRIYRTRNGLRLLEVSRDWSVWATGDGGAEHDDWIFEVLKQVLCDPDYVRISLDQHTFRARLDPKPWRIKQGDERACKFVAAVGVAPTDPTLEPLIAYHDRATNAHDMEAPLG